MNYKKIILVGVSIIIIAVLVVFAVSIQKNKLQPVVTEQTATSTSFANMKPLPLVDEMALQKQLQEILAKGKDSDCVNLGDARYQFACHDLFKNMKK